VAIEIEHRSQEDAARPAPAEDAQPPADVAQPDAARPAEDAPRSAPAAAAAPSADDPARLAAGLSAQEKVGLVVGAGMWTTAAVPRVGLRAMTMSDGSAGVRGVTDDPAETAASFPAPSALGATWDEGLAARVGAAFAVEARRHGVDVVLAPQVNLQRTPVGGRHFECFSEDPVLTAALAVPLVRAAQERGVGMCPKHYVANDSETERTSYVSRVDERTLREVYLAPFEALVREAGVWCLMGAYNGVDDGVEAAPVLEHHRLLAGVLKREWGFDGVLVSDWVATQSVVGPIRAGMDLQMPGPDGPWGDALAAAVASGEVDATELDDKVARLLRLATRVGALGTGPAPVGELDVAATLREVVARSLVVLKDDDGLLPLAAPGRIALIGPNAVRPFLAGGGSSQVRADREVLPAQALATAFPTARIGVHEGATSRLTAPPLDLTGAATPGGAPGVLAELLDARGDVLRAWTTTHWDEDVADLPDEAVALRLRTRVPLREPGVHRVGVGTVGRHRILVDGVEVSVSGTQVGAEVVLDSSYNHPQAAMVQVAGPGAVELDATVQVVHPVGYDTFLRARLRHDEPRPASDDQRAQAVAAAAAADVAVVVVGTTEEVESEGWDRTDLHLPGGQDELVRAVLAAQPRTVVVVNAGAPVLLPWLDEAPCVLWGWLGGQEWADGLADALSGAVEPSGRLPWTLPRDAADVPVPDAVPVGGVVEYREGVHVGYRSWDLLGRAPAAPFGHGLGWTTWEYSEATARWDDDGSATVVVTLRNTGPRAGREVVQVYVEPPAGTPRGERPVRWLGGFAVADVPAGQPATVQVRLHPHALRTWDTTGWATPAGTYPIRVGRSSRDLRLTTHLTVPGPEPGTHHRQ
jgi:beta-glucosidase